MIGLGSTDFAGWPGKGQWRSDARFHFRRPFLLSASCGVLAQLSVVGECMQERQLFPVSYPRVLLHLCWIAFVCGLVAFVVFTWANVRAGR